MKNTLLNITAISSFALALFAFTPPNSCSITGKIMPASALKDVWVVSAKDTVRAIVVQGGFAIVNIKPGTYKVIINAEEPYKDVIKEDITVATGHPVDMGEIKLNK